MSPSRMQMLHYTLSIQTYKALFYFITTSRWPKTWPHHKTKLKGYILRPYLDVIGFASSHVCWVDWTGIWTKFHLNLHQHMWIKMKPTTSIKILLVNFTVRLVSLSFFWLSDLSLKRYLGTQGFLNIIEWY